MALVLAKKSDLTSVVSNVNAIETSHNETGDAQVVPLWLFNDSKRKSDSAIMDLLYKNIVVDSIGVRCKLASGVNAAQTVLTVKTDDAAGIYAADIENYNKGTILRYNSEELYVESVNKAQNQVTVIRGYNSTPTSDIPVDTILSGDDRQIKLQLPSVTDYSVVGSAWDAVVSGDPITVGLNPSKLTTSTIGTDGDDVIIITVAAIANLPPSLSNIAGPTKGSPYIVGSLLKIDNEIFKVTAITNATTLQVLRATEGTVRGQHNANATVYLVGLTNGASNVASPLAHPVFMQVKPPANLPTQKKKDVYLQVKADEYPL